MAEIKIYRTYDHYRDPVIDEVREKVEQERLIKKLGIMAEISGLSRQTLAKWFDGTTRRPQYTTVMAAMGALGWQPRSFYRAERFDMETARAEAKRWKERQEAKKKLAKARLIARRKAARASAAAGATYNRS